VQAEGPHRPDPDDGVEELLLLCPAGDPLGRVDLLRAAEVPARGPRLDRHGEQRADEEPPVQRGQADQGEQDDQRRPRELRDGLADRLADRRHVGRDPRGEIAGAGLLEPPERQLQRPGDEPFAHRGEHGLADPREQPQPEHGQRALHHRDHDQQQHRRGERGRLPAADHEVDDPAQERSGDQARRGPTHEREQGGDRAPAVRPDQLAEGCTHRTTVGDGEQPARAHASTSPR
jgi:hypothetical protein